jgi:hypothetical protein
MPRIPISTMARIRRDRWEQAASERFGRAIARCNSKSVAKLAEDFAHKTGVGRQRALAGLMKAFDGIGALEACEPKGPRPIVLWSVISATTPGLLTALPGQRDLTSDEEQPSCGIHYLAFGRLPGIVHGRGLWGMSATKHAIGRFFDRGGNPADLDTALLDAHRCLLGAPSRSLPALLKDSVLLEGGAGFFWAEASPFKAKETGANVLHCRCRTWMSAEMAKDTQIAESAAILKRDAGDTPLVAGLLHPMHLRSAPAAATAA